MGWEIRSMDCYNITKQSYYCYPVFRIWWCKIGLRNGYMIVSIEATDRWYKLQYLKICHQSLVIGSFCIEYEENNVFFSNCMIPSMSCISIQSCWCCWTVCNPFISFNTVELSSQVESKKVPLKWFWISLNIFFTALRLFFQ